MFYIFETWCVCLLILIQASFCSNYTCKVTYDEFCQSDVIRKWRHHGFLTCGLRDFLWTKTNEQLGITLLNVQLKFHYIKQFHCFSLIVLGCEMWPCCMWRRNDVDICSVLRGTSLRWWRQWRTQEFCSRGGVQQIQLRTDDRENGDVGAVAPYSVVLEVAVIWYKKFHII
jgi:hypothetical protein